MDNHSHNHAPKLTNVNRAFVIGIVLNLSYVVVQIIIGLNVNSLSILSDAGHNFLDVAGLALSLLAFKLSKIKATEKYTYGYKKSSVLIALFNAVLLLLSIGAIGYEAIFRFQNPQPIPGETVAIIALIGVFINGISAFFFFRDKENDLNVKSAFLHLMSDALVSLGLVIGGVLIYYTQLYWIDPLLGVIICVIIIVSTWKLLKESLQLSLNAVPENVDMLKVKQIAANMRGVLDFRHIHVWAVSTTENALTGHLVVAKNLTISEIHALKQKLKHELEHQNIEHCTIETEVEGEESEGEYC